MIRAEVFVDIDRPPGEVFAFVADVENTIRWQLGVRSCTWTSEPPLRVGSTYDQEASVLGRPIRSSFEVIEHLDGRRIRTVSTAGPVSVDITCTVSLRGDGGSMVTTLAMGDAPPGMARLSPVVRRLVRRWMAADHARLRDLLETS